MLTLKILGAVLALWIGFMMGLPGRYEQSQEDLDRAMARGGARRNQVRRRFTFLNWYFKEKRGSERRRQRSPFKTAAPRRRDS